MIVAVAATFAFARGISVNDGTTTASKRRVALVIGNGGYASSPLRNPVNDARLMTRTLRDLGFEVIEGENLDLNQMKRAVRDFGGRLGQNSVGLFYYAGHGMQVNGLNYLIPVGARIDSEFDVELEGLDVRRVLVEMREARNRLNLVFLDACRDNPFARSFRTNAKGLAQMPAPSGTLIAYATAPGSTAADGSGRNGVFTEVLARQMTQPGLMIESVLKRTRREVSQRTGGKQIPWDSSSLTGDFYFKGGATQPKPIQLAGGPGATGPSRQEQIAKLLDEADALMRAGKLTSPAGNNALEKYNRVLFLQPMNSAAAEGLKKIAAKYVEWARARIKAGDYAKAEVYLQRAEKAREGDPRVLAALDELKTRKESQPVKEQREFPKGSWSVCIVSYPQQADAENHVQRLVEKGGQAFTLPVRVKGGIWYRVCLGLFWSLDQAKKALTQYQEQGLSESPFPVRLRQ